MRAADIIKALGGQDGMARCPSHDDRTPSLSVTDGKSGKILVHCHAGCEQHHVIDALRRLDLWPEGGKPLPMTEAERERRRQQEAERESAERRRNAFIDHSWRQTWESGTAAAPELKCWFEFRFGAKLASKLDLGRLPLRWAPHCPRGRETAPAMIALMTDTITGKPCGIHRTYLLPDGSGKSPVEPVRMMLGKAGVIRLSPDDEVGLCLGITEGIETGLALLSIGWQPIWACGSLGNLQNFPIIDGLDCITVFADPKPHEIAGARACGQRWADAGREAKLWIPPEGKDFNDVVRGIKK